jgi:hypothetical protein
MEKGLHQSRLIVTRIRDESLTMGIFIVSPVVIGEVGYLFVIRRLAIIHVQR